MSREQETSKKLKDEQRSRRRSLLKAPSKVVLPGKLGDDFVGTEIEETEIAAQVTLSVDGGWAWVVLVCATIACGIIDGVVFSFGPMLPVISKELGIPESIAALINATEIAFYFMMSPASSALVNRFGFRAMGMTGSIISSMAIFTSYFTKSFGSLLLTYGIINGIGLSVSNISASIVCGFYFEKLRKLSLTTVSAGASIGVMILYPVSVIFIELSTWRALVMFQAGLVGILYFLSLSFRPLLNLTIAQTEDEGSPTRTVTYLPTVSNAAVGQVGCCSSKITNTERILKALSNAYFPTAAAVIKSPTLANSFAPSAAGLSIRSKITLKASTTVNRDQLKQMQSIAISARNIRERSDNARAENKGGTKAEKHGAKTADTTQPLATNMEIIIDAEEEPRNETCCGRLFHWHPRPPETRPMYRDDAFYTGKIEDLEEYKKHVLTVEEAKRTGLEYQLAVTRAAAISDLKENRGVCTTAVRRVLVSMLDPSLLKKVSFIYFCLTGFFIWSGVMIPYIYIQPRAEHFGLDPSLASYLVSAISVAGVFGKILGCLLASRFDSVTVYGILLIIAGMSTILSGLSYSALFQYGYALLFGLTLSPSSSLRSLILVESYGLENLTNSFGLMLLAIGFANIYGTPLGAVLKNNYGFDAAFYVSGGCIVIAGLIGIPFKIQLRREKSREAKKITRS